MQSIPLSAYDYSLQPSLPLSYSDASKVPMGATAFEDYPSDVGAWELGCETSSGTGESSLEYNPTFHGLPNPEIDDGTTNAEPQLQEFAGPGSLTVHHPESYRSLAYSFSSMQDDEHDDSDDECTGVIAPTVQPAPNFRISDQLAAGAYSSSNSIHTEGLSSNASPAGLAAAVDPTLLYNSPQLLPGQHYADQFGLNSVSTGFDADLGSNLPATSTGLLAELNAIILENHLAASLEAQGSLEQLPQTESPTIPDAQSDFNDSQLGFPPLDTLGTLGCDVEADPSTIRDYADEHIDHSLLHDTGLMEGPVASSSRHVLNNIQPGQEAGEFRLPCAQIQHSTMDAASGSENSFPHPHALPERRQQRSKVNRKKPYDQKKEGTRRSKASSSTAPDVSSDSDLEEEDYFRPHQAIVCPFPVGDQRCGALVNSAKAMFKHLTVHGVDHRKSENVNSHLGGRCPLKDICNGRMKGGSIHRHLMEHFFHLKCPEWGCSSTYSRCYELKRHCREEHSFGLTGKDDDYVVRKDCWD